MRFLKSMMACLALASSLYAAAVPAMPGKRTFKQPDGSTITLELRGDEYGHFYQTTDGQMVLRDGDTFYFATTDEQGNAVTSTVLAADPGKRSAEQKAFLSGVNALELKQTVARQQELNRSVMQPDPDFKNSLLKSGVGLFPNSNVAHTGSPRFLVILVEYQDVRFSTSGYTTNAKTYFTNLLTRPGFSESSATGSAYDYFNQTSKGQFTPQFDVYGPVLLDHNRSYYGTNTSTGSDSQNSYRMVTQACQKLDSSVDFSQYDTDNDGYVDNVFVFYAGQGENSYGPAESVWPHQWYVKTGAGVNLRLDGKYINRYACTNEWQWSTPDGIGTFVHEFSHVLGLPDLYVTDYGEASNLTPGSWDVMDVGSYNNNSRTPPTYSSFERNALGWISPISLTAGENRIVSMNPLLDNNEAYIINSPNPPSGSTAEFFLLENRQKTGWDAYLPSSGMLIWHIDYVPSVWKDNKPNNSASHQYVDIIEAYGLADNKTYEAMTTYSFPGSRSITFFDNFVTWRGTKLDYPITDINVQNGVVNFELCHHNAPTGPIEGDDFVLVTNAADLVNKREVVIAAQSGGTWYAMTSNSERGTPVTVTNNKIPTSSAANAAIYTLVNLGGSYPFALKDKETGKFVGNENYSEGLTFSTSASYGYTMAYNPALGKNAFIFSTTNDCPFLYYYTPTGMFRICASQSSSNYICPSIFIRDSPDKDPVQPPVPSAWGGTYTSPIQLTFTPATPGDVIKYQKISYETEEGTYTGPITCDRNVYIRAWSERDGNKSDYVIIQFSFKCATPNVTPTTGTYTFCPMVTLTCDTPNTDIYYSTTDDSFSVYSWTKYTGPFIPSGSSPMLLRAVAVRDGWSNSDSRKVEYTFNDGELNDGKPYYRLCTDASELVNGSKVIIAADGGSEGWWAIRGGGFSSGVGTAVNVDGSMILEPSERVGIFDVVESSTWGYPISFRDPANNNQFFGSNGYIANIQFSSSNTGLGFSFKYDPNDQYGRLQMSNTSRTHLYYSVSGNTYAPYERSETGTMVSPYVFLQVVQTVATPVITPVSGTYDVMPQVSITCKTSNAEIYYTTTESDFSKDTWIKYAGPFTPTGYSVNLRAVAVRDDMNNSNTASAYYMLSESGVDAIEADAIEADAEYFNLQGIKITNPQPGNFYIRRQGSKVTRIYVK